MFKEKERIAIGVMDEYRCNLQSASYLYDEMQDCIWEWIENNGYPNEFIEFLDAEVVFWAGPGND